MSSGLPGHQEVFVGSNRVGSRFGRALALSKLPKVSVSTYSFPGFTPAGEIVHIDSIQFMLRQTIFSKSVLVVAPLFWKTPVRMLRAA